MGHRPLPLRPRLKRQQRLVIAVTPTERQLPLIRDDHDGAEDLPEGAVGLAPVKLLGSKRAE
jgi:hypothetical protein